jgi:pimeloyl-ACP methyl ester carboxylesterase
MTPLILLPGMMCDARLFEPQIAGLAGLRPIISAPIPEHANMTAGAQDFLSWAPPKFALAGLSMGGILAMEILRQAPDRVQGLALMDTNHLPETEQVKLNRKPQITAVLEGNLVRVMRDEMKPNYLTNGPNRAAILELCMAMAKDLGPNIFVSQSKALRDRIDQTDTLRSFVGPTLILCGRDDVLCPVARHQLMNKLMPQSILKIIENAGHLPTLEQPDQTTAALSQWMESLNKNVGQ